MKRFFFLLCSGAALLGSSCLISLHASDSSDDLFSAVGPKDPQRKRSLAEPLPPYKKRAQSFIVHSPSSEEELLSSQENLEEKRYGIATYDALFKYVLSHTDIAPSFMRTFIPGLNIKSCKPLDEHMHPVKDFQILRTFLSNKKTEKAYDILRFSSDLKVTCQDLDTGDWGEEDPAVKNFFIGLIQHFKSLQKNFPKERYDGKMDFVCHLDNNERALVEMQVIPQDHWDQRALAYAANLYSHQLLKGGDWGDLKKVIAINILGERGGSKSHWKTPDFMRHYKFQDQLSDGRFIDGIEVIQYAIAHVPEELDNQTLRDWTTYLHRGHLMTKKEVEDTIQCPEVLKAFELSELERIPAEVRKAYEKQDKEFKRYSKHTEKIAKEREEKGREEGEKKKACDIALGMLKKGMETTLISEITGLSEEEIASLRPEKE